MEEKEGIVRNVVVRLGLRGQDVVCREMRIGVQRLTLVTPVEKVDEETSDNISCQIEEIEHDINYIDASDEEVKEVDDIDDLKSTRELRDLQVPSWMKPTGARRSSLNSVMSYSTLQGLNLGVKCI